MRLSRPPPPQWPGVRSQQFLLHSVPCHLWLCWKRIWKKVKHPEGWISKQLDHHQVGLQVEGRHCTFQFEFVLQLFVNLIFVELGISRLKVKVLFKLHRAIPTHIHFASAAVSSSSATAVGLSSGWGITGNWNPASLHLATSLSVTLWCCCVTFSLFTVMFCF